jgi:nitroimidazol reductase NimA-like FMN-containing flavoprotein (pyridoxamine 5'-phosphate oxidase superfamily)
MDHRNGDDRSKVREWLKLDFNWQTVLVAGEAHKVAKSTRGREALTQFVEDVVAWLQDNYAPPTQALEPASFKEWRVTVREGPDNYIDYLVAQGVLKKSKEISRLTRAAFFVRHH